MVTELRVQRWVKPATGPHLARIETPDIVTGSTVKRIRSAVSESQ